MIRSFILVGTKFIFGSLMLASLFTIGVNATSQGKASRVIPRTHEPISKQLSADDEHVLVEEFAIRDFMELSNEELIRFRTGTAKTIVVFRTTAVAGELTDDGTWIKTRVRGVIEQAIKGQQGNGHSLEFYVHGGEARIGKVRVQAGDFPVFKPGHSYLVFVGSPAGPETMGTLQWVHERDADGKLKRVEMHRVRGSANAAGVPRRRSPFEDRTVDDVAATLRKYLQ